MKRKNELRNHMPANNIFILRQDERPDWLEYPRSYHRIVDQQLIHITPWHILEGRLSLTRFRGLAER